MYLFEKNYWEIRKSVLSVLYWSLNPKIKQGHDSDDILH